MCVSDICTSSTEFGVTQALHIAASSGTMMPCYPTKHTRQLHHIQPVRDFAKQQPLFYALTAFLKKKKKNWV